MTAWEHHHPPHDHPDFDAYLNTLTEDDSTSSFIDEFGYMGGGVGIGDFNKDGLPDIFHVVGQGVIAGASMVLVDFHPAPTTALCDGPQALSLADLPRLLRYTEVVRSAFEAATTAT